MDKMDRMKLDDKAIFYGNGLIPLHIGCEDCHYFNYECPGSVYNDGCDANILTEKESIENTRLNRIAFEMNFNNALLGLVIGAMTEEELTEHLKYLHGKITNRFSTTSVELNEELLSKVKENTDLLDELEMSSNNRGYIRANLNTMKDIELALKTPHEEIVRFREKYNIDMEE